MSESISISSQPLPEVDDEQIENESGEPAAEAQHAEEPGGSAPSGHEEQVQDILGSFRNALTEPANALIPALPSQAGQKANPLRRLRQFANGSKDKVARGASQPVRTLAAMSLQAAMPAVVKGAQNADGSLQAGPLEGGQAAGGTDKNRNYIDNLSLELNRQIREHLPHRDGLNLLLAQKKHLGDVGELPKAERRLAVRLNQEAESFGELSPAMRQNKLDDLIKQAGGLLPIHRRDLHEPRSNLQPPSHDPGNFSPSDDSKRIELKKGGIVRKLALHYSDVPQSTEREQSALAIWSHIKNDLPSGRPPGTDPTTDVHLSTHDPVHDEKRDAMALFNPEDVPVQERKKVWSEVHRRARKKCSLAVNFGSPIPPGTALISRPQTTASSLKWRQGGRHYVIIFRCFQQQWLTCPGMQHTVTT